MSGKVLHPEQLQSCRNAGIHFKTPRGIRRTSQEREKGEMQNGKSLQDSPKRASIGIQWKSFCKSKGRAEHQCSHRAKDMMYKNKEILPRAALQFFNQHQRQNSSSYSNITNQILTRGYNTSTKTTLVLTKAGKRSLFSALELPNPLREPARTSP